MKIKARRSREPRDKLRGGGVTGRELSTMNTSQSSPIDSVSYRSMITVAAKRKNNGRVAGGRNGCGGRPRAIRPDPVRLHAGPGGQRVCRRLRVGLVGYIPLGEQAGRLRAGCGFDLGTGLRRARTLPGRTRTARKAGVRCGCSRRSACQPWAPARNRRRPGR